MKIKELLFGGAGGGSASADFGLLLLRLGGGVSLAMAHGFSKLPPDAGLAGGVEKLGFPMPEVFAWLVAFAEAIAALFVAAGLLTRPMALVVVINFLVVVFMAHGGDPFAKREMGFLYLMLFVPLLFTGAGRYSVDAAARK